MSKFKKKRVIAAALVGAAIAAAPAVAQEVDPSDEITLVKMPQSSGDWPPYWPNTVNRPEFIDVVQAQGRFFALAGGQRDSSCSGNGSGTVCFIQYDWTEGVWTARDITQPPRPGGYDFHAIATDGTNLVVSLTDGMNADRLYHSSDLGQTWISSSVKTVFGYAPSGDKFADRPLFSGSGFMAIGAGADYTEPNKAIVSTDGGANFGPSAALAANQGVTGVASDTGSGIAWATSGTGGAGVKSSVQWTSGFGSTTDAADIAGPSWVANLGPATYVVAKDNRSSYYRPAPGQAVVPGPNGFQAVTDLIAAPDVSDKAVIEISGNGYVHLRDSQRQWPSLTYMTGVKRGSSYGNLVMLVGTNGSWGYMYNTAKMPEFGFDFDPDKITGNDLPELPDPPLVPPPDVPAVIDGEHSVIMPELGVTPEYEDGKPVTVPATGARWKSDADGYCEWRKKKVACVSQMNPLPEATDLYTLKANLSGTSVSRKGACRWTDSKPQCRVWLTQKGTWRLTWGGENAGKVVTGARTVIVK